MATTNQIPANHVAYTAPINPSDASPVLTVDQVWQLLEIKITAGQVFVPAAILTTDVLSTSTDKAGNPITEREVVFREGGRRVHETCVAYKPMKVEFIRPDGSKVINIVSAGSQGELYMTYTFEWLHPELEGDGVTEALAAAKEKEWKMAKTAVEDTIRIMREMVRDGKVQ